MKTKFWVSSMCLAGLTAAVPPVFSVAQQSVAQREDLRDKYTDEELDAVDDLFDFDVNLYGSGTFGFLFNFNIPSNDIIGTSEELEFSLDDDIAFSGAFGIALDRFRIEFETQYFETDYTDLEFLAFDVGIDGDLSYLLFMGNLFYDFPLTPDQKLKLYFGAGLGVAVVESDADLGSTLINVTTVDGLTVTTPVSEVDDNFATFAYQFLVGLSYEVVENVHLTGGYRIRLFSEASNLDDPSGLIFREHEINALEVGFRVEF
ncbi:MAG: outer membrane beta-barrel protein [Planctomycetota bacterium]